MRNTMLKSEKLGQVIGNLKDIIITYGSEVVDEPLKSKDLQQINVTSKDNIIKITGKSINYDNNTLEYEEEIEDSFELDINKISAIYTNEYGLEIGIGNLGEFVQIEVM